jgi:hypothetical protein
MAKGPFTPDQFVATEWSTAEEKSKFGNTFLHFVQSEWKPALFTKKFYQRLSITFGHIAHTNIHGFYNTWFERDVDRLAFLRNAVRYPCYGDPAFTFCDVERAIQSELRKLDLIVVYEKRVALATRKRELDELARLQKKYGTPPIATAIEPLREEPVLVGQNEHQRGGVMPGLNATAGFDTTPVQGTLF